MQITNARALATMYAALLGPVNGIRLVEHRTLSEVNQPRTDNVEPLIESGTAGPDIRFGLGYQLSPGQLFEHVGYVCRDLRLGDVELAGDGG